MNQKQTLALFPGQGSQKIGMGKSLLDATDLAKEMFQEADNALGFALSKICFEGPAERLTETAITQPAILTVSSICFVLASSHPNGPGNIVAAAGHSLGEYSALVAAGALDFRDAVQLVHKRGTYMQEAVPMGKGKMVAVLGKELAEIEVAIEKTNGIVQVANINSPIQVVVAGEAEGVDEFVANMGEAKIKELDVSAPFHCELMEPAAEKLAADLATVQLNPCNFPVYANYSAKPLTQPEDVRKALELQVCGRVRWVECMQNAIADTTPEVAVEFGEGNVAQGLLKRIDGSLSRAGVGSPESLEKLFG